MLNQKLLRRNFVRQNFERWLASKIADAVAKLAFNYPRLKSHAEKTSSHASYGRERKKSALTWNLTVALTFPEGWSNDTGALGKTNGKQKT